MVPKGLRRSRWVIVRRKEDGQLFFWKSVWRDASGNKVDDSKWIHALGPDARARSRIEGDLTPDDNLPPPPPPLRNRPGERPDEREEREEPKGREKAEENRTPQKPPQDVPPATPEVR
jgi:hypothetical protein